MNDDATKADTGRIVTWRRHHGHELAANVIVQGTDSYAVFALHEPSGVVRREWRTFARLDSAKAAADDLVRRSFKHTCTVESCGEWLIWSA
jgi:hypothetical protein